MGYENALCEAQKNYRSRSDVFQIVRLEVGEFLENLVH
jgi:hypothetical protein